MTSSTPHPMTDPTTSLGQRVTSSAIHRLAVTGGHDLGWNLLVIFKSDLFKVYSYAFKDVAVASEWTELLADDQFGDLDPEFSWGKHLHKAVKSGELIKPEG